MLIQAPKLTTRKRSKVVMLYQVWFYNKVVSLFQNWFQSQVILAFIKIEKILILTLYDRPYQRHSCTIHDRYHKQLNVSDLKIPDKQK